ncbi:MAG TPA: SpoIIE family protein phosphatase [Thermoanaerobaculia bacterium]|nr:SpoIIE family protein phosphatase [Thermoanaerobaculia bacterium]
MKRLRLPLLLVALVAGLYWMATADVPVVSVLAAVFLFSSLLILALWGAWRIYQGFLWRVGRRLAFSYFLIGVLPIPLVVMLLSAATYILAGYFLGHLYRDAVRGVAGDLDARAEAALATGGAAASGGAAGEEIDPVAVAVYRDGRRVEGDPRLPESWPSWVPGDPDAAGRVAYFALVERQPTVAAAAGDAARGALAVYAGDFSLELSRRTDTWVRVLGPSDPESADRVNVQVMGRNIAVSGGGPRSAQSPEAFFSARAASGPDDSWLSRQWDRPILWWSEVPGPLLELATGEELGASFLVTLNAPPATVPRHLFSGSAEFDVGVWSALLFFAFLLFDVYAAAAIMAGVMIYALSRAVNRMSSATEAVRAGDFSVRIPVRRRDQVGELQRSFNLMAENLEQLVATATQKEILEKELAIARDLQKSLIPSDLPAGDGVEFATLFEPSAAIGGDYFDILRLSEDRLAVIIADVSGHGLPTGLRMAMLKSALNILAGQQMPADEILARLDAVVRLDHPGRFFVTATFGVIDFAADTLELTNAGHPPTYVVRRGGVREVMLPGSPLGGLGKTYGSERLTLEPGDVVVWLSDGFIEARDADSEPFGYEGVEQALAAAALAAPPPVDGEIAGPTATAVRDALVAAVHRHTAGERPDDDRTLVVMRYKRAGVVEAAA